MLDGGKDGLPDVRPCVGDGSAVESDEVLVGDASHEMRGEALEDGHRGDGLESSLLKAGLVIVTEEIVVLLLKVEAALGVVGFRDDDLKDGEGFPARIDAGEDLAGDVDAVVRDLDDTEVVAGEALAVGLDAFALILRIAVEVGDVLGQEVVDGDGGAGVFRRIGVDALLVGVGLGVDIDADVLVVDDLPVPGDAESVANRIEAGDALLAVEYVLDAVSRRRLGELDIADIPQGGEFLAGLPDDEGA